MKWYDRLTDRFSRTDIGRWTILQLFTPLDRRLMRVSKGRLNMGIGSRLGAQTLLLTTIGHRSGRERAVPILCSQSGEDWIVVASRGGHVDNPAWYYNLKQQPACRILYRGRNVACTAREADGEAREYLWNVVLETFGGYANYAARTDRRLPVMVLTPKGGAGA